MPPQPATPRWILIAIVVGGLAVTVWIMVRSGWTPTTEPPTEVGSP